MEQLLAILKERLKYTKCDLQATEEYLVELTKDYGGCPSNLASQANEITKLHQKAKTLSDVIEIVEDILKNEYAKYE